MEENVLTFQEVAQKEVWARLYGEPFPRVPEGLFIPPDALRVFLESFEGPLDLLLFLIRRQKFNILDIPMAALTRQYNAYVEMVRRNHLELAATYLVMSATLLRIKSRLLLPVVRSRQDREDPRSQLMEQLLEYEKVKWLARQLNQLLIEGRDFWWGFIGPREFTGRRRVDIHVNDLAWAWEQLIEKRNYQIHHTIERQELSIREHMVAMLKRLQERSTIYLHSFWESSVQKGDKAKVIVYFLAMLELAKEGLIRIEQDDMYGPIQLIRKG